MDRYGVHQSEKYPKRIWTKGEEWKHESMNNVDQCNRIMERNRRKKSSDIPGADSGHESLGISSGASERAKGPEF